MAAIAVTANPARLTNDMVRSPSREEREVSRSQSGTNCQTSDGSDMGALRDQIVFNIREWAGRRKQNLVTNPSEIPDILIFLRTEPARTPR